jgi:hypothetical protein
MKALFLGLKWPGREADHSPPSSAKIKNGIKYFLFPISLRGQPVCGADNLTAIYEPIV